MGDYYHEVCPLADEPLPDGWGEAEAERAAKEKRQRYAATQDKKQVSKMPI